MKTDGSDWKEKVEALKASLGLHKRIQEIKTFQTAENQKSKKDSEQNKKIEDLKSLCLKILGHNINLFEQWDKWHFLEIEQVLKDGLPELTLLIEKLNEANCFEDKELSLLKKELEREKKLIEEDVKDGISENELLEHINELTKQESNKNEK